MKLLTILLFIGLGLLMACSSDDIEAELTVKQQALQDSLDLVVEQENLIRSASAQLIGEFASELRNRLADAIKAKGPSGAINECRLAAPEMSKIMSQNGWSIKRVTDKFRNTDNRATMAEKDIMAIFADSSQHVRKFFGDWKTEDSVETYSYYRPIWARKFCLKCHGDMQTLAPGVYNTIKKHYPLDKATGYKDGDLRGMFVVEATWPEGKAFAMKLISGEAFDSLLADTSTIVDTTVVNDSTLPDSTN